MAHYVDRVWPGNPTGATRAERSSCRYRSYVPDPLVGRPLALGGERSADIVDVERALLELGRDHPGLVSLEALARLLLRAEAVASSFIEGLRINVRRLAKEELAQRTGVDGRDETARAVLGNVRAMETALTLADPLRSVRVDDVLALHQRLLAGTRDEAHGGRLREDQSWVGGTGLSPCTAEFVPPPPELVGELMEDLCTYLSRDDHPATVQAALVHAQFETIHPFADGNGRTGRALIHIVFRRRGLAPHFVPPISLVLATHADAYIRSLTAYRYQGDAEDAAARDGSGAWLDRFLADTMQACTDAGRFAEELETLEAMWRARVGAVRARSATDLLLSALPAAPVVTADTATELIGRSEPRVNDAIRRLVEAGVLRQTTVGRRNRAFEAPELVAALTGFERALASPVGDTRHAPPVRPAPVSPGWPGRPHTGMLEVVESFQNAVRSALRGFRPTVVRRRQLRPAAVAIALVEDAEGRPCFLLTRRAARLRTHAGQWALPGGRLDDGEGPEDAARRELHEELGLDLPGSSVLGRLDDYASRSGYVISPVVLWAGFRPTLRPQASEVAQVHLVPLADLDVEPRLVAIPESEAPVIQIPLLGSLIHAPTAAVLYQFRELALYGRHTRVAHFEQPVFAWR